MSANFIPPIPIGQFKPSSEAIASWLYEVWKYLQENPIPTSSDVSQEATATAQNYVSVSVPPMIAAAIAGIEYSDIVNNTTLPVYRASNDEIGPDDLLEAWNEGCRFALVDDETFYVMVKNGDTISLLQVLTEQQSVGVISVNGATGIVNLTSSNIPNLSHAMGNTITAALSAINTRLSQVENHTFLIVGNRNADFTTITEAINHAHSQNLVNPCILIQAGEYNEAINLLAANNICLYGIGNVVVNNTAATYPSAALYVTGNAEFHNITFQSQGNATSAYGLHIEALNDPSASAMRFVNCKFVSLMNHGAGIGMGSYYDLKFINCEFMANYSNASGMFIHNYPQDGLVGYSQASFIDCRFNTLAGDRDITIHDAYKMAGLSGSSLLELNFINCSGNHMNVAYSEQAGNYIPYLPSASQITLTPASSSQILGVNYYLREIAMQAFMNTDGYGNFAYPFPSSNRYNITPTAVYDAAGNNITANTQILAKLGGSFAGQVPANSGVINFTAYATPI